MGTLRSSSAPARRRRSAAPRHASTPSSSRRASKRPLAAALVIVMAAGCLVLWLGGPLAWLRIASWLSDTGYVIYLVALVGCPITMALWGWGLYRINNVYLDLTGQERRQSQPRWLESASKPSSDRRQLMLLDVMMVVSVLL